jgi:hypothetical protein
MNGGESREVECHSLSPLSIEARLHTTTDAAGIYITHAKWIGAAPGALSLIWNAARAGFRGDASLDSGPALLLAETSRGA